MFSTGWVNHTAVVKLVLIEFLIKELDVSLIEAF